MKPLRFNVLTSEIKTALLFASNDETRYILNGVRFEFTPGERPLLVSCDGRRLCVIHSQVIPSETPPEAEQSFTVSSAFLKQLCGFAKCLTIGIELHAPKRAIFHLEGIHCVVDSEEGAVIEGDYPDWRKTIPATPSDKVEVEQIAISALLVADFSKACKFLGSEQGLRMHILGDGPIEVHITGKPQFYGLIMPMRGEPVTEWQPDFLQPQAAEKVAD